MEQAAVEAIGKLGFLGYYWECCKHFGERVWESKGKELTSALVLSVMTGLVSWAFGVADAFRAFEIAIVSLVGWLTVFAVGHLIRTPWLMHYRGETKENRNIHWGFGVLGIVIGILMISGAASTGLLFHEMRDSRISISIPTADPESKNAEITSLKSQLAAVKKPVPLKTNSPKQSNTNKPLDIACQHLADCASEELSKRANELADKIEGIAAAHNQALQQEDATSRQLSRNDPPGSTILSNALGRNYQAENWFAITEYRKYRTDAISMRKALSDRLGEHNTDNDSYYEYAESQHGHITDLDHIVIDLRQLAGKVLAMRQ